MERPRSVDQYRVSSVMRRIAEEIIVTVYCEGYFLPGKDPLRAQPFIPLCIEGVGRRWGQSTWRKAAAGDEAARNKIITFQRKVETFYNSIRLKPYN